MQSATRKSRSNNGQGMGASNKPGDIETSSVLLTAKQMLLVPAIFTFALFLV